MLCAGTDFSGASSALELDFNAELANHFGSLLLPVVKGSERSAGGNRRLGTHAGRASGSGPACELLAVIANRVPPTGR
ncbi:MAG: hypothetical protein R3E89_15500 [Thiolinea sp.]